MRIRYLIWDDWNVGHIAEHGVAPEEVEEVCYSERCWNKRGRSERRYVLGQTEDGRYLSIILAPRGGGAFYTITARDMDRKERRLYSRWRG
jgi:uncharacterized DUF497 family protein